MTGRTIRQLISFLDGSLRNCEQVLFSNHNTLNIGNNDLELRPDLSARQIAKIYGFTQKLLTNHIDSLGLEVSEEKGGYQQEIRPVRKAFVRRCNLILDKLEDLKQHQQQHPSSSNLNATCFVESEHSIVIAQGVVYGSVYIKGRQATLYIPPIQASELLFKADSCQCDDPQHSTVSRSLLLLEHIIQTTQQRLRDNGLLEDPSNHYHITS